MEKKHKRWCGVILAGIGFLGVAFLSYRATDPSLNVTYLVQLPLFNVLLMLVFGFGLFFYFRNEEAN